MLRNGNINIVNEKPSANYYYYFPWLGVEDGCTVSCLLLLVMLLWSRSAACLPHWSDDVWAAAVVVACRSTRYLQGVARPCGCSVAGTPLQSTTVFMKCGIYGTIQIIWGDGWVHDKVHGFMIMGWGWGCKVETRTDSIGALTVKHALNGAKGVLKSYTLKWVFFQRSLV